MGNLTKLTGLYISSNNHYDFTARRRVAITGSIPTELGNLTALTELNLSDNDLTGSIPSQLGKLIALTDLRLNHNSLTGSIPTELGNLTALTTILDLQDNPTHRQHPHPIEQADQADRPPAQRQSTQWPHPRRIGRLTDLTQLFLNNNQLTGNIPDLSDLTNLTLLSLSDTPFTAGAFPSWVSELTSLTQLFLNSTQRTGNVASDQFADLTDLTVLNLSGTNSPGIFPPAWAPGPAC